ncbi:MAG: hypothetical protein B7X88_22650 [Polaromonas sp. 17-63-33]|nr:MAG: hypothetical protein B7Y09_09380 [Polaromonas sp. 24-63-21]OZA47303.1 MAG: hypothetical protein B7X88_22650 [Polaromonas sp. 17-63-33]
MPAVFKHGFKVQLLHWRGCIGCAGRWSYVGWIVWTLGKSQDLGQGNMNDRCLCSGDFGVGHHRAEHGLNIEKIVFAGPSLRYNVIEHVERETRETPAHI